MIGLASGKGLGHAMSDGLSKRPLSREERRRLHDIV
jgi:hypothetical protein